MIRVLLMVLALPVLALAQPLRWTTYTSTSNVVDLAATAGQVWAATSGGISGYDPGTNAFDVYTNTRGLAMNNSQAVGKDSRGWIWAAHQNGAITRIDPQTGATRIIDDLRGEVFEFTRILDVGDEVFVAANNGIYRLSYYPLDDNYRILETVRQLLNFPGETRVADLAVAGGYIYAATSSGLARASLSQGTLSAPERWETFVAMPGGLPENNVNTLFGSSDGALWIATTGHVVRYDGSTFTDISPTGGVHSFAEMDGNIYAATGGNAYRIDASGVVPIGQSIPNVTDLITLSLPGGQELVLGIGDSFAMRGGISFWAADHWTDPIRAPGIGSNLITELAIDPRGRLWGGGSDAPGVFVLVGDSAKNYVGSNQYPQRFFHATPLGFAFDDFGGTWAGSTGGGIMWFHGDSLTPFNPVDSIGFDVNGPRLVGTFPNDPYLIAVPERSPNGDIYITDTGAHIDSALIRVDRNWIAQGNHSEPWRYFTPQPYALVNSMRMVFDMQGRLWIGVHDRSYGDEWVFDGGNGWFNYEPDSLKDPNTCFDELPPGVTSWDIDSQGYIWIGSHSGAYYSQAGIPSNLNGLHFVCVYDLPVGQSVNAVHVDANDNKWFGTDDGVAVMDKNFTWVHVFKTADATENRSGLASNNVTSITSNPLTGDIWIGTDDGLSRLQSPYVATGGDLQNVKPYPNPFTADGQHRMFINHQELGGVFDELRVYTISGRLVRKISWAEAINPGAGWDGRNGEGELVAGGVYLLVASTTEGNAATGKVAVLGK